MANQQDELDPKQISDSVPSEIDSNDVVDIMYVELGRTSGPPQVRTKSAVPK